MEATRPRRSVALRFAEILNELGKRLHIGCVMAAGRDWVEVSVPEHLELGAGLELRFLPVMVTHGVTARWRREDRVGFTYRDGGPPEEAFAGIPGLADPRPAAIREHEA